MYRVDLQPERPAPRFLPGQFLHLALDDYQPGGFWPESRVFSIANSPDEPEFLQIYYSVAGKFTARMEKELVVGRDVWIKLPYGDFLVRLETDTVLLAGGTGITAFRAFLRNLPNEHPHQLVLAYGARTSDLLLLRDEINLRSRQDTRLQVLYFVERDLKMQGEIAGRISIPLLQPVIQELIEPCFYLSGPPPMMKTLSGDLSSIGIPAARIRVDAWG